MLQPHGHMERNHPPNTRAQGAGTHLELLWSGIGCDFSLRAGCDAGCMTQSTTRSQHEVWTGHGTTHLTKEHIEPPPSTPATRCVHHSNRSKIGTTCTAARAAKRATSKPTRTSSPRADTFRTTASCTRRGVAASARTLRGRRRWRGGRCAATAGASATGSRAHWPGGTSISTALVGQRSPCRAPRGGTAVCSLKRGNGQKMRTYVTQSGGTSAVRDKRSEDAMWSARANRKCGVVGTPHLVATQTFGLPGTTSQR